MKKHIRMIKNRESASMSRKRRKEFMEHLDVSNKQLQDENEQLKKENSKLLIRLQTLEMEVCLPIISIDHTLIILSLFF